MVYINGYLTVTNAFPSSELVLGSIPVGTRPAATIRLAAAVSDVAYTYKDMAYLGISTNGSIYITAKSGNTYKVCYFSVSYIAQN